MPKNKTRPAPKAASSRTKPKRKVAKPKAPASKSTPPQTKKVTKADKGKTKEKDELLDRKAFRKRYYSPPPPRIILSPRKLKREHLVDIRKGLEGISEAHYSQILEAIRQGAFLTTAAGTVGIPAQTISRWKLMGEQNIQGHEAGEESLNLYGQFYQDVTEALNSARVLAENKEIRANATNFLMNGPGRQTRDREGYAPGKQALEISGRDGGPIEIQQEIISREDKRTAVAGALAELASVPGLLERLMQGANQRAITTVDEKPLDTNGNGNGRH